MSKKKVDILIAKYVSRQLTAKEIKVLLNYLYDPDHLATFNEFVKINYAADFIMTNYDSNKIKEELLKQIRQDKSIFYRKRFRSIIKYAAIAIFFLGIGFYYKTSTVREPDTDLVLIPSEEFITLKLGNGMVEVLNTQKSKQLKDSKGIVFGNQKNQQLTYKTSSTNDELVYNTLNIPYGKQFKLQLSDGTKINLNSGTTLRYPVSFSKEGSRKVFLIGEAYFDVAEDKSRPFIVNSSNNLDTKVLGTEFNITAYEEDNFFNVLLVEGAVSLINKNDSGEISTDLVPGQMGSYQVSSKKIKVKEVNVGLYTSWMDGLMIFRDMTFDDILIKLERRYNIEIENTNKDLGKEVFNASFNNIGIEEILSFFNATHEIEYTIKKNKIYIN